MVDHTIETDVLVVGGGLSGLTAALRATEKKAKVVLADKNHVGRTGGGYFAWDLMVFNPEWGDDLAGCVEQFQRIGEYVADLKWTNILLKDSYPAYCKLIKWGVPVVMKDGTARIPKKGEEPQRHLNWRPIAKPKTQLLKFPDRQKLIILRNLFEKKGGQVLDRTQITELIKEGGKVVGAVGFNTVTGDFYVIKAKAVIISAGGFGFKGAPYGTQFDTGDGSMMGLRAGAEIVSMEFSQYAPRLSRDDTLQIGLSDKNKPVNAVGEDFLKGGFPEMPCYRLFIYEEHRGRGPLRVDIVGEGKSNEEIFMAITGTFWTGGLRVTTRCETNISGLYASGDASSGNHTGALYAALGSAMAYSLVSGYRAGYYAARYASKMAKPKVSAGTVAKLKESTLAPLNRKSGYRPEHVLTRIQDTVLPYEISMLRHEKRLQAALTIVEFIREHFAAKMMAEDSHDLRNAHEAINIAQGSEVLLRASLLRKESRGFHLREDYPKRDDAKWLKWIIVTEQDGKLKLRTKAVPKEYVGDLKQPYNKRYVVKPLE